MSAIAVDIADAVVDLIQDATFALTPFVERQWVETQQLENMRETDPPRVIVVPRFLDISAFDLKPRTALEWTIAVWIDRKVRTTPEDCDPVAELMEQIALLLASNRDLEAGDRRARCIKIGPDPTYDSTQLLDVRVFRAVLLSTYRVTL